MTDLRASGYSLWPSYPIAGLTVDLVVERDRRALGIDLIGYPGELASALDLERYRMFRRAGLFVFGLPYSAWKRDREACLEAIARVASSPRRS